MDLLFKNLRCTLSILEVCQFGGYLGQPFNRASYYASKMLLARDPRLFGPSSKIPPRDWFRYKPKQANMTEGLALDLNLRPLGPYLESATVLSHRERIQQQYNSWSKPIPRGPSLGNRLLALDQLTRLECHYDKGLRVPPSVRDLQLWDFAQDIQEDPEFQFPPGLKKLTLCPNLLWLVDKNRQPGLEVLVICGWFLPGKKYPRAVLREWPSSLIQLSKITTQGGPWTQDPERLPVPSQEWVSGLTSLVLLDGVLFVLNQILVFPPLLTARATVNRVALTMYTQIPPQNVLENLRVLKFYGGLPIPLLENQALPGLEVLYCSVKPRDMARIRELVPNGKEFKINVMDCPGPRALSCFPDSSLWIELNMLAFGAQVPTLLEGPLPPSLVFLALLHPLSGSFRVELELHRNLRRLVLSQKDHFEGVVPQDLQVHMPFKGNYVPFKGNKR